MKRNITMRDIANELNVSTVTVSKALADKEGVSEALKTQIKELAVKRGYKYNAVAKGMKEGCTYNIGILVSERFMNDKNNSFYWNMYQQIVKYLTKLNYAGILELISLEDEKKCKLPNLIENNKIDGIIMLGQVRHRYIDFILDQNIPLVFLDFYDKHFDMDSIVSDNMYGAYLITSYLVQNGHTDIGFVGNIYQTSSILDRYLGYYKTLVENKLEIVPEWIIPDRDEDGKFCDFALPSKMPTAFVCNCDEIAFYFIQYLNEQGYKVPEDISVVGFDNFIYSTLSRPQITTVEVEIESMSEFAVTTLLRKIKDEDYKVGRKVVAGNLVIRDSVRSIKNEE